jgi:hypothetical protein
MTPGFPSPFIAGNGLTAKLDGGIGFCAPNGNSFFLGRIRGFQVEIIEFPLGIRLLWKNKGIKSVVPNFRSVEGKGENFFSFFPPFPETESQVSDISPEIGCKFDINSIKIGIGSNKRLTNLILTPYATGGIFYQF